MQSSYRGHEVKLVGRSTYSSDFARLGGMSPLKDSVKDDMMQKTRDSWKVISTNPMWMGPSKSSTHCRPMTVAPQKGKGLDSEYVPPVSWANQFASTYRSEFTGPKVIAFSKKRRPVAVLS